MSVMSVMGVGSDRARRGFTLAEVIAALTVVMVAGSMFIALLMSSRAAARKTAETRLAATIAQAAYERLRSLPPEELKLGQVEAAAPAMAESIMERLGGPEGENDAKLTATVGPWQGDARLRHLRVVLTWRSSRGGTVEVVREGIVSDAHVR